MYMMRAALLTCGLGCRTSRPAQRRAGRGLGCQLQRRSPRRPFVIIPSERNVLINPKYADGARRALVRETVPSWRTVIKRAYWEAHAPSPCLAARGRRTTGGAHGGGTWRNRRAGMAAGRARRAGRRPCWLRKREQPRPGGLRTKKTTKIGD